MYLPHVGYSSEPSPQSLLKSHSQRFGIHLWLSQRKSPIGSQVTSAENKKINNLHLASKHNRKIFICEHNECIHLLFKFAMTSYNGVVGMNAL